MLCDCPFNKEGCNPYTQTHVVYSHPEDCLKYFRILVNMIGWVPSINTPCKLLQTTWLEECLPKLWYDIDILREIKIKTVFLMYTSLVLSIVHIKICPPKTCVLSYMLMYILMQTTARRYPLAQTLAIQLHPLLCFNTCHRSKGVLKLCAYCLLPAPQWFWSGIDFFLIIQVDTRS